MRAHRKHYALGLLALVGTDLINVVLPLLIKESIDAIAPRDYRRVIAAGVAYFVLMTLQAGGRYLWRIYLIGSSHLIAQRLRLDLYGHLQKMPLAYYQRIRTGDLMSRATNDIESIRMAVGPGVLVTVDAAVMFLFLVPAMFYLSPKLALLAFAFYPFVPWLTAKLGDRIDNLFEGLQKKLSRMSSHVQESFSAIRLVKSLVLENHVARRFRELSGEYRKDGLKLARYESIFSPLLGLLTNLGTFLILLLGGFDVMEGVITVGTFVAFQRFVVQLSWPMEAIGWAVTMNREGFAAERRLQEVLAVPAVQSVRASPGPRPMKSPPLFEIRRLHHRFTESNFTLDLADLSIEPGKKVGIVGAVGAGKSTLFQLMLRLYETDPGSLFFEGRDVASVPLEELRCKIASVEQGVFLFSERIDVNIAMGAEKNVTPLDVERAARTACIDDEIGRIDHGYAAALGERGVNLSGGQKQRIALARALVRKPELLLLDDSFSAVDVAVEDRIIENFFRDFPNLSLCFASHRLSVMPRLDEIWLIDGGKLVQKGSHSELMRRNVLYGDLWERSERRIEAEQVDGLVVEEAST